MRRATPHHNRASSLRTRGFTRRAVDVAGCVRGFVDSLPLLQTTGVMGPCVRRDDVRGSSFANMPSRSRGALRPRLAIKFPCPPIRRRRESRVRAAPAVSCANCTSKNAHEHTGPAEASDFPCAVVLRLIRTLPGDRAFLPPSPARLSASLTPASGCQDHTISPSASSALVRSAVRVHRIPAPRW